MRFEQQVDDEINLRLLESYHAEALFALVDASRQHLREWLPWLDANVSADDTRQFVRASQEQLVEKSGFVAGIWFRDELVGVVGQNQIDWENRVGYPGYWLAQGYEGKGIMTKSCRALIDHAFGELELDRIIIHCAVGNRKSRAIPERLGFREEGVKSQAEWLYDKYVDHVVYGLLKSDWSSEWSKEANDGN